MINLKFSCIGSFMTYCCALRLKQGLVFISDTRTNAGVDHISVYRKLYTFGVKGERFICIQKIIITGF